MAISFLSASKNPQLKQTNGTRPRGYRPRVDGAQQPRVTKAEQSALTLRLAAGSKARSNREPAITAVGSVLCARCDHAKLMNFRRDGLALLRLLPDSVIERRDDADHAVHGDGHQGMILTKSTQSSGAGIYQ